MGNYIYKVCKRDTPWAVSTELVDIAIIVCYNSFDELQLSLFYIIIAIFETGGLVMKTKQFLITACMLLLLCACQSPANTEDTANDLPPENVEIETPASDSPTEEEPAAPLPLAPPVCEIAFTETESFPLPFEEELLVDEEEGILLSAGQALYDYDTMWELLEENYPYFDVIKQELGISSRVAKTRYRAKLVSLADDGYISQEAFINTVTDCLNEFQKVGHLFVILEGQYRTLCNAFCGVEFELYKNMCALLHSSKTAALYTNFPKQQTAHDKNSDHSETLQVENIEEAKVLQDGITLGYADNIPYLRIPVFNNWSTKTQTAISDFFDTIAEEEHLIIDIRGNPGGNTAVWAQDLGSFLTSERILFSFLVAAKPGPLNLALNPALCTDQSGYHPYSDASWRTDFPTIPLNALESYDVVVKATVSMGGDASQTPIFHSKIWVLIDKKCYSAADTFAYFCKSTGFATLVGEQTGGNGIGAQPYVMALPYSGLLVYYEPYLSFNLDGTCNGIMGTSPDVIPDAGQTALEACVAAIQHEKYASAPTSP